MIFDVLSSFTRSTNDSIKIANLIIVCAFYLFKESKKMEAKKERGIPLNKTEKDYALVSLCLLGTPCRYHGCTHRMGHRIGRPDRIEKLRKRYSILPLCPEQLGGLPTPRPPCRVTETGKVIDAYGADRTSEYNHGAQECLRLCQQFDVKRAYLLKDSPACGKNYGVLAKLLTKNDILVIKI